MANITVSNISKSYGRKKILSNVSFSGTSGDIIGIVGPNGSGKSTLLKILSGAIKPSSGTVSTDKSGIAYVPQNNALFDNLTVKDNLKLAYCDSPRSLKDDIQTGIIKDFGIDAYLKYTVSKLSGGTKKKLSIICSLARNSQILLLDEPGASLDIVYKNDIIKIAEDFAKNGGIVIIVSHEDLEIATCNKLYWLSDSSLNPIEEPFNYSALFARR